MGDLGDVPLPARALEAPAVSSPLRRRLLGHERLLPCMQLKPKTPTFYLGETVRKCPCGGALSIGADLPRRVGYQGAVTTSRPSCSTSARSPRCAPPTSRRTSTLLHPPGSRAMFPNMSASADYPFPMIATRDIGVKVTAHELMFLPHRAGHREEPSRNSASPSGRVLEKLGAAISRSSTWSMLPPAEAVPGHAAGGHAEEILTAFAEMNRRLRGMWITAQGDPAMHGRTDRQGHQRAGHEVQRADG